MLDDDQLTLLAMESDIRRIDGSWRASGDEFRAFGRACYTRGLQAAEKRIAELEREVMTLRNQRDELRIVLEERPAMSSGLYEAYASWSANVYTMDWMDAGDAAMRKEGGE